MGLCNASVTIILISDMIFFDTGLNKALFGSKVNGYDLLKLSVGIIISVFVNTPIQFNSFAINKKIQHKYIIDNTQYSYYYNIHT